MYSKSIGPLGEASLGTARIPLFHHAPDACHIGVSSSLGEQYELYRIAFGRLPHCCITGAHLNAKVEEFILLVQLLIMQVLILPKFSKRGRYSFPLRILLDPPKSDIYLGNAGRHETAVQIRTCFALRQPCLTSSLHCRVSTSVKTRSLVMGCEGNFSAQ